MFNHCSLLIVHCSLLIAHCSLLIVHCSLFINHCSLIIDYYCRLTFERDYLAFLVGEVALYFCFSLEGL